MNFNELKTDDPGGSIESAYAALKAMTHTVPLDLNRIGERDIYTALGSVDGEKVLVALESGATMNPILERVIKWLQPGEDMGIDICDPEVQAVLNGLVGGEVTQQMIDDIISLSEETRLKYPGLQTDDINTARGLL